MTSGMKHDLQDALAVAGAVFLFMNIGMANIVAWVWIVRYLGFTG